MKYTLTIDRKEVDKLIESYDNKEITFEEFREAAANLKLVAEEKKTELETNLTYRFKCLK